MGATLWLTREKIDMHNRVNGREADGRYFDFYALKRLPELCIFLSDFV